MQLACVLSMAVPAERLLHFRYEMRCQLFYLRWFVVSYFNWRLVQSKTSEKVSRCSWRSFVFSFGLGWVLFSFLFFPRLRALKTCEEALKFLLSSSHQVWEYLSPFQVHTDTNQHELLPGQMFAVESEPEEPGLQPSQRGETTCPRTGSCQPLIAEPLFDRQPLKSIKMFLLSYFSVPKRNTQGFHFQCSYQESQEYCSRKYLRSHSSTGLHHCNL